MVGSWIHVRVPKGTDEFSIVKTVELRVNGQILDSFDGSAIRILDSFDVRANPSKEEEDDSYVIVVVPLILSPILLTDGATITITTSSVCESKKLVILFGESKILVNRTRLTSLVAQVCDPGVNVKSIRIPPHIKNLRDIFVLVELPGTVKWLQFHSGGVVSDRIDIATLRAFEKSMYETDFWVGDKHDLVAFSLDIAPLKDSATSTATILECDSNAYLDIGLACGGSRQYQIDILIRSYTYTYTCSYV
jgi:hypothetical protein